MTTTPTFDGVIRQHQQDPHLAWAMLPSGCPQNHAANLLPLPDGTLLCVWFGGSQEGKADISVWGARLAPGATTWSEAVK
ncbi:TPA: exo-alpha-sialidase, partial [Klebsiella aerogenes]|nr:exo-alpha-sialidase [Klebsiella aerogenes]